MSPLFQEHFSAELVSLLEEGAIEELRVHPRLCLSPVFVIPKRSGSLRLILFLKRINLLLGKSPFRMDLLTSILPALNPVDVVFFFWIFATPIFLYRSINDLGIFWGLPVQGTSLWVAPRSSNFHENRVDGHGASTKTGSSSFRLFGRLALGRVVGGSAVGSFTDSDQHDSRSRFSFLLGEIGVRPDSYSVLSRGSACFSSAVCSSQSHQSRDDCRDCSVSRRLASREGRALASVTRVSLQSGKCYSSLSTFVETLFQLHLLEFYRPSVSSPLM